MQSRRLMFCRAPAQKMRRGGGGRGAPRDANELYGTLYATLQTTPALPHLTSILQHLMLVTAHPIRR